MLRRLIASIVCVSFIFSNLQPVYAEGFRLNTLPVPGTMVSSSKAFVPVLLKGLVIHPDQPFNFDFIVDSGNDSKDSAVIKEQSERMIRYFLTALTVPSNDLWVNLSPYEKDRIITNELGQTDMGRDMLAQDYMLKQLTASMIYPEKDLGKEFWSRVYKKVKDQTGDTNIPVNTFNKVWIVPNGADVFENGNAVYVTKSKLKVMLEEDYLAMEKHDVGADLRVRPTQRVDTQVDPYVGNDSHVIGNQTIRDIVLPEIEKEVNEGANFAVLRQVYSAAILAKWYREAVQKTIMQKIYIDQKKISGVDLEDKTLKEQIYQRYIAAYKKGVFNYIKEDTDNLTGQMIPRKYFSGGTLFTPAMISFHLVKAAQILAAIGGFFVAGCAVENSGDRYYEKQQNIEFRTITASAKNDPISFLENPANKTPDCSSGGCESRGYVYQDARKAAWLKAGRLFADKTTPEGLKLRIAKLYRTNLDPYELDAFIAGSKMTLDQIQVAIQKLLNGSSAMSSEAQQFSTSAAMEAGVRITQENRAALGKKGPWLSMKRWASHTYEMLLNRYSDGTYTFEVSPENIVRSSQEYVPMFEISLGTDEANAREYMASKYSVQLVEAILKQTQGPDYIGDVAHQQELVATLLADLATVKTAKEAQTYQTQMRENIAGLDSKADIQFDPQTSSELLAKAIENNNGKAQSMFHHIQVSDNPAVRERYSEVLGIVREVLREDVSILPMNLDEIHVTIANDDIVSPNQLTLTLDQLAGDLAEDVQSLKPFDIQLIGPHLMPNGVVIMEYTTSAPEFFYLRKRANERRAAYKLPAGNKAFVPNIMHSTVAVIRDPKVSQETMRRLKSRLDQYRQQTAPITINVGEITATHFDESTRRFIDSRKIQIGSSAMSTTTSLDFSPVERLISFTDGATRRALGEFSLDHMELTGSALYEGLIGLLEKDETETEVVVTDPLELIILHQGKNVPEIPNLDEGHTLIIKKEDVVAIIDFLIRVMQFAHSTTVEQTIESASPTGNAYLRARNESKAMSKAQSHAAIPFLSITAAVGLLAFVSGLVIKGASSLIDMKKRNATVAKIDAIFPVADVSSTDREAIAKDLRMFLFKKPAESSDDLKKANNGEVLPYTTPTRNEMDYYLWFKAYMKALQLGHLQQFLKDFPGTSNEWGSLKDTKRTDPKDFDPLTVMTIIAANQGISLEDLKAWKETDPNAKILIEHIQDELEKHSKVLENIEQIASRSVVERWDFVQLIDGLKVIPGVGQVLKNGGVARIWAVRKIINAALMIHFRQMGFDDLKAQKRLLDNIYTMAIESQLGNQGAWTQRFVDWVVYVNDNSPETIVGRVVEMFAKVPNHYFKIDVSPDGSWKVLGYRTAKEQQGSKAMATKHTEVSAPFELLYGQVIAKTFPIKKLWNRRENKPIQAIAFMRGREYLGAVVVKPGFVLDLLPKTDHVRDLPSAQELRRQYDQVKDTATLWQPVGQEASKILLGLRVNIAFDSSGTSCEFTNGWDAEFHKDRYKEIPVKGYPIVISENAVPKAEFFEMTEDVQVLKTAVVGGIRKGVTTISLGLRMSTTKNPDEFKITLFDKSSGLIKPLVSLLARGDQRILELFFRFHMNALAKLKEIPKDAQNPKVLIEFLNREYEAFVSSAMRQSPAAVIGFLRLNWNNSGTTPIEDALRERTLEVLGAYSEYKGMAGVVHALGNQANLEKFQVLDLRAGKKGEIIYTNVNDCLRALRDGSLRVNDSTVFYLFNSTLGSKTIAVIREQDAMTQADKFVAQDLPTIGLKATEDWKGFKGNELQVFQYERLVPGIASRRLEALQISNGIRLTDVQTMVESKLGEIIFPGQPIGKIKIRIQGQVEGAILDGVQGVHIFRMTDNSVAVVIFPSAAMAPTTNSPAANGGIDLKGIKVNKSGQGTSFQFDPAQISELTSPDFRGFKIIVNSVTPIQSPLPLLGINEPLSKDSVKLVKV